jgi:hypothetical protein
MLKNAEVSGVHHTGESGRAAAAAFGGKRWGLADCTKARLRLVADVTAKRRDDRSGVAGEARGASELWPAACWSGGHRELKPRTEAGIDHRKWAGGWPCLQVGGPVHGERPDRCDLVTGDSLTADAPTVADLAVNTDPKKPARGIAPWADEEVAADDDRLFRRRPPMDEDRSGDGYGGQ